METTVYVCSRVRIWTLVFGVGFVVSIASVDRAIADETQLDTSPNTQALTIPMTPPAEALAGIELPDGFTATLFAAEPDVHQPIAATFDSRGRLWVAECYTYSDRQENFNLKLNDRIVIFEDADNDGVFDSKKVFWDKGKRVTGIEIGFKGVWVTAAPNLLFIPDHDGDDRPDGPAEVRLDGFDADTVRHNFVNGPKWGPDGWLYGRHGILATSYVGQPGATASQRTPLNCGIWRYHPTQRKFEVVAHGGTNPWGFDYDRHGEMFFINTVIGHCFHLVPGARYRRMSGSHFNPHTYDVIPQSADHFHWDVGNEAWSHASKKGLSDATDVAGGGHAHSGMLIYQADHWPESFRDKLFTLNFQGRRVNSESLHRQGNSYVAKHGADYFKTSDPWFRGVELLTGPAGGVVVLDWSDIGECHENDGVHRTSGRIFKISYGEQPAAEPAAETVDLEKLPLGDLVDLFDSPNQWHARQARRILQQRAAWLRGRLVADDITAEARRKRLGEHSAMRQHLHHDYVFAKNPERKLQAMWAIYACEFAGTDWLLQQSHHANEHIRVWAVRMLADGLRPIEKKCVGRFVKLATEDPSGLVRLYLASSLPRLKSVDAMTLAAALSQHASDADDRVQPHLIWTGVEPHVVVSPDVALQLAAESQIPLIRQSIVRRLTYEIESQPAAIAQITKMLDDANLDATRLQILNGMWQALDGIATAPAPEGWSAVAKKLASAKNPKINDRLQKLNLVFGEGRAIEELRLLVSSDKTGIEKRKRAIETLATRESSPQLFELLRPLLTKNDLAQNATRALVHCTQPAVADALLERYAQMAPPCQSDAINTLAARESWAERLVSALAAGDVPTEAITSAHARQIADFGNARLTSELTKIWGQVTATSAERQQQMAALRDKLTADVLAKANVERGRLLFEKHCGSCHVMRGQGGRIGPDLTGSDRKNLNYLLENIIAPSAIVAESYQTSVIMLEDGRLLTGVVLEQNDRTLKLQTKDELLTLDVRTIEESKRTKLSLMPDGLLDPLSTAQKAQLFGYLQK